MNPLGFAESAGRIATGLQVFFCRKEAIDRFGTSRDNFLESFWAAALCFPAFLWLFWLGRPPEEDMFFEVGTVYRVSTHLITHAIDWVYWPLIMAYICDIMGKPEKWIQYVVALNWTMVTPYFMLVILSATLGMNSGILASGIGFGVQIWIFWVQGWLIRVILGAPMPLTVGLVIGNFALSTMLLETQAIIMFAGL